VHVKFSPTQDSSGGQSHDNVTLEMMFTRKLLLNCKIVSEMTYNVSSGTLNPTIPYMLQLLNILYLNVIKSIDLLSACQKFQTN